MAELNLEAERALFEAEMRKTYGEEHFVKRMTAFDGLCYDSTTMSGAWKGWQAARRAVPAQASAPADVYALLYGEQAQAADLVTIPRSLFDSTLAALRKAQMFKVSTALAETAQVPAQGEMDAGPAAALVKGRSVYEWYASYCEVSEKLKAADGCIERYKKLVEARPAAASGEAVRQNMELVIARLTDIVDAAETADCDLMESSAKDALPCAKAVLASLATAPSQPEASADKLALTDAVRAVIRDINSDSGEGWCAADEEHYWNAIIATLKGQRQ